MHPPGSVVALLAAGLAVACQESSAAEMPAIRLARGFEPSFHPASGTDWSRDARGRPLTLWQEPGASGLWVECTIDADDWTESPWPGIATCARPLPAIGTPADGSPRQQLSAGERAFEFVEPALNALAPGSVPPGSFGAIGDRLFLCTGEGERPPASARFRVFVDRGAVVDGAWRVPVREIKADGIPVWPGTREELRLDVPPGRTLSVGTTAVSCNANDEYAVTFRIRLDGELLLETVQPASPRAQCAWHCVELPPGGRSEARLAFEVEGPPAVAAFLDPTLVPAAARTPAPPAPPDCVLVVLDTFRADNLAVHGGAGFAPELDRLAERSVVFERTWSTSTWTLPAVASLLSGLAPPQHGADRADLRLSADIERLPDRLAAAGYRTVALTDGSYVSPEFGLDDGFEYFEGHWIPFEARLDAARAALRAKDERPLFLLVHTYRTHEPYRVSEETRRELAGRLDLVDDGESAMKRVHDLLAGRSPGSPRSDELAEAIADVRALYLGAVRDASRALGRFVEDLERDGYFEHGYLIVTSDHGEAFLEHGHFGHGATVFEEIARVPLLIRGPGLAPSRVEAAASLLDLPRTVAALTGIEPSPRWGGRALLPPQADAPVVTFECRWDGASSVLALVDGERKYLVPASAEALAAGSVQHAFDLAADAGELRDLLPGDLAEAQAALERSRSLALLLSTPLAAPEHVGLDARSRAALEALGYAGR